MKKLPLTIISLLLPLLCAALPHGRIVAIDNSVFVAYVDVRPSKQKKDNWCWAACVQMILRYNGIYESQRDIVSRVYGAPYDWSASGNEIADAFNGWNGFSVQSFKSKKAQTFVNEIVAGHPLMIGYEEHAYLLTHIYYRMTSNEMLTPFKVIMINPSLGKEEVFDWNDFFPPINTIVSFSHKSSF